MEDEDGDLKRMTLGHGHLGNRVNIRPRVCSRTHLAVKSSATAVVRTQKGFQDHEPVAHAALSALEALALSALADP